jgi:hypothetical protein
LADANADARRSMAAMAATAEGRADLDGVAAAIEALTAQLVGSVR